MQDALQAAIAADRRLVAAIPADARRILLMSRFAPGYAEDIRRTRPTASVFVAGMAGDALPDGVVGIGGTDTDGMTAAIARYAPYDAILADGALEAAASPETFLKSLAGALAPDGVIVLRVANVHHWSRVAALLVGNWTGGGLEPGLSDEALRRLLKAAGLDCLPWRKSEDDAPAASPLGTAVTGALAAAEIPAGRRDWLRERIGITHYLVTAKRAGCLPRPLFVHARALGPLDQGLNASVARVRLIEPAAQLESFPGVRTRTDAGTAAPDPRVRERDRIFLWQRVLFRKPSLESLQPLHDRGYVVVLDFDDHPSFFKEKIPDGGAATFRNFHAVQTSTPELADYIRRFNPEVAWFGNQVPVLDPLPRKPDGPVRVLFAAVNRKAGWERIVDSFRTAMAEGLDARAVVVGDREFFEALGPVDKEFLPILGYDRYQALLSEVHVALLPLADTEFDRAKTDLKFIECAARGTAVLASPVVYAKSVRDGSTGFLYRSPEEFAARLRILVSDHARRRQIAQAAYDYVREERMLSTHVRARLDWYRSLVARRQELHAAALERMALPAPEPEPAG